MKPAKGGAARRCFAPPSSTSTARSSTATTPTRWRGSRHSTKSGRHVAFGRVRPLIGMGAEELLPEVSVISADSPEDEQISKRRGEIFLQRFVPAPADTVRANWCGGS